MNFWPIDDNLIDVVAGANMTQTGNANFANDRFQNVASAISFNGGSYSVPPGIYFNYDFSITLWGNLDINASDYLTPILSFTNWADNTAGNWQDGIALQFYTVQFPIFLIFNATNGVYSLSNKAFNRNTWTHFALTLNGNTGSIYIDGILASSRNLYVPNNVVRNINNFGSHPSCPSAYAKIDFVKFYNRSLSSTEIQTELNQIFKKISN